MLNSEELLLQFFKASEVRKLLSQKKIWSSELQAANISLAEQMESARDENNWDTFNLRLKFQKNYFRGELRVDLYIVLRILNFEENYFFSELLYHYFPRGTDDVNSKIRYLASFDNKVFGELIEKRSSRWKQNFIRNCYSKVQNKSSILEFLLQRNSIGITVFHDTHPVKDPVRHKGYRDHGSLGSEFSQTLRQQTNSKEFENLEGLRSSEIEQKYISSWYEQLSQEDLL